MAKKISKNLQKVQDMLDGNRTGKLVVGMHTPENIHANRKVGDKWTDSEGDQWEQMNGYRAKINKLPSVGLFSKQCKDCKKNCSVEKKHLDTWKRMERCYYCQLNFEVMLKSKKIGHKGNKWNFWVKLQELKRWTIVDKEIEHWVLENSEVKWNDKKFLNALANNNVEMSVKKNL